MSKKVIDFLVGGGLVLLAFYLMFQLWSVGLWIATWVIFPLVAIVLLVLVIVYVWDDD